MGKKIFILLFFMGQFLFGQTYSLSDIRVNQPKNFRATSNGSTITLSWDWDSSIPTTGFRVYRSETGGEPFVRPTGGKIGSPNARSFTDTDALKSNQDYYYIIQPYKEPGDLRGLESLKIVIKKGESSHRYPNNIQGPTNLKATLVGNDVRLTWDWDPQGLNITGFKFERAKNYERGFYADFSPRLINDPNARAFTDVNPGPGIYVYRCFAYNASIGNYTFSETAAVIVTSDGTTNQLTVSPSNRNPSSGSGSTTFSVSSNVSWSVSDNASWLTVSPTSGSNNGTLTATYSANGTSSSRTGTITVSGGGITRQVTVSQAAATSSNQLSVSPSNRSVSNGSGSTTFSVSSDVSWSVSDNASWLTISPTSGSNNGTLTATYTANGSTSSRTGTVTVSGGGLTSTVTVSQAGSSEDPIDEMSVPQNVTAIVVNGTIRVDWEWPYSTSNITGFKLKREVNNSGTWTRPAGGKIANVNARSFTDEANLPDGIYSYQVRAYFSSGGDQNFPLSDIATAEISGDVSGSLAVSPSNRSVSNGAGSTTFIVSSDVSWSVSDNASWLTVSPTSGSNNGTLTAAFTANGSTSSRTGIVTVSGGGITRNVTVTQSGSSDEPADEMSVPQNVTATVVNGTIRVDWEWPYSTSNITGFKLKRDFNNSGTWSRPAGGKIANVNARSYTDQANLPDGIYSYQVRAYFSTGGDQNFPLSETAVAEISGDAASSLIVSPTNRNVSNSSGSTTFIVSSDVSWSVSDNAGWLTVTPTSGSNNGTLTAAFTANGTGSSRTGTVTVTGGGITRNVTVTQSGTSGEPSDEMSVPQNVTAAVVGGTIMVSWEWPFSTSNITGFKLVREYNNSGTWIRPTGGKIANVNARSYTDEANLPAGTYTYRVRAYYSTGGDQNFGLSEPVVIQINASQASVAKLADKANAVSEVQEIPQEYNLLSNYPNPFNPTTVIEFSIPEESTAQLKIYDVLGREVASFLNNETISAGSYKYNFNASDLPSGIYVYVLTAESHNSGKSFKSIKKMMLLK